MKTNDAEEEQFASALEAWDERLAAGDASLGGANTPAEVRDRLERTVAAVKLLHEVRPRVKRPAERAAAAAPEPENVGAITVGLSHSDTPSPAGSDSAALARSPAKLGRFQIRRELGRGGFGVVLLAHDPRLHRDVALKVPRSDTFLSPELRARFQQEARAAAGLDHPNIVPVFDAGEVGPICYIASAYCPGVSLAAWLRQRALPVPCVDAAELVALLADAVQHAHDRGVLHRDLKPANILLLGAGGEPSRVEAVAGAAEQLAPLTTYQPKITDFGLAKVLEPGADAAAGAQTKSGAIFGTPSYMAPEQAGGKAHTVGPTADIYALGAVLYELLTGRPPFRGESELDTLLQVRHHEPLSPRRLRPGVPRDLETICLKCLHKEAHKRYESARALAEDLRRFVKHEPIRARPVGRLERTWRWCRRKPAVAALLTALALVVIAALSGMTWLLRLAEERAELAERRRDEAEESFLRGVAAINAWFTQISEEELLNAPGLQPLRGKLLQLALAYYQQFLAQRAHDVKLRGELIHACIRIAKISDRLGDYPARVAALYQARDYCLHLSEAEPDNPRYVLALAICEGELAAAFTDAGKTPEAYRFYSLAQQTLERLAARGVLETQRRHTEAAFLSRMGVLQRRTGDVPAAGRSLESAKNSLEELERNNPSDEGVRIDLAFACEALGNLCLGQKRLDDARALFRQSVTLHEKLLRAKPASIRFQQGLANAYKTIGTLEADQKRPGPALEHLRQALPLLETLARENPRVPSLQAELAWCLNMMGVAHKDLQQPAQAVELHRRATDLLSGLLGSEREGIRYRNQLGQNLHNVALSELRLRGRLDSAVKACEEAIAHQRVALAAVPDSAVYRDCLRMHWSLLYSLERRRGRLAAAVAAAAEIAQLYLNAPDQLYLAASFVAHAAGADGQNKQNLTSDERAERHKYADQAIDLLRQAVSAGFKDIAKLKTDASLDPLRARPDFQELVAQLEKAQHR